MSQKKQRKGRPEAEDEAAAPPLAPAAESSAAPAAELPPEHWRDQYLRVLAELQNVRRRTAQEVEERTVHRLEALLGDLLRVDDYFAAALGRVPPQVAAAEGSAAFLAGVGAIRQALDGVLSLHGLVFLAPGPDAAFDPIEHEAVEVREEPGLAAPRLELLARGCRLGRRVLRPARVRLLRPPAAPPHAPAPSPEAGPPRSAAPAAPPESSGA